MNISALSTTSSQRIQGRKGRRNTRTLELKHIIYYIFPFKPLTFYMIKRPINFRGVLWLHDFKLDGIVSPK